MHDINKLLEFAKFTILFQQVKRSLYATGEKRSENDSEHSFQLAIIAWFIIDTNKLNLDLTKVLKYSLAHDLVEIYGGDTFIFSKNKDLISSKSDREHQSFLRIQSEFNDFKEMLLAIKDYEEQIDEESKFVYALDKILPPLNIYLDNGRTWRKYKVKLEMIKEHKDKKVLVSNDITIYWEKLRSLLESDSDKLFKK